MRTEAWSQACVLTERYLRQPVRADRLFAKVPFDKVTANRRICQFLFYGVVRHRRWLEYLLDRCLSRRPRPAVYAALCLGLFEMISTADTGRRARIVHAVVGRVRDLSTDAEARMANAVLRRLLREWDECMAVPSEPEKWGVRFSHPDWLVHHWRKRYGEADVLELLRWNQNTPSVYVYFPGLNLPEDVRHLGLGATPWSGFYRWDGEDWEALLPAIGRGDCWIQDPSTHHPVELLFDGGCSPENILELCAAPGGKTRAIAARLAPGGRLVSVDVPGERFELLKESVSCCRARDQIRLLAADVRGLDGAVLSAAGLPETCDAVLIDVPCSNTGVLQRRPEVKDRLSPADLRQLVALQRQLLAKAVERVRPGGRLVFSTCSIETEENAGQVEWLLDRYPEFSLARSVESFPVRAGHDGAGAWLLLRAG